MKRFLLSLFVATAGLLATACYTEQLQRLDELEVRVDDLTVTCDQLNANLSTLRNLVEVIQRQDMITGITEILSGTTVTGYRINFVQHDPITVSNGSDGKKPLIASLQDTGDKNYYWAVRYGDDDWEWLRAPDGSRMLSIGVLPYVSIRNGMFVCSVNGQEYELGKANGENGDQMFKSIDAFNSNYVLITLATGEVLKIPTYTAYLSLKTEYALANEQADAQVALIRATREKQTWITSIDPILDGADTTGLTIVLSNGKQFSIRDWTSTQSPAIFVKRDSDGHYYWAYNFGTQPDIWVLSPDGSKISAEGDAVETPQVSVARDSSGNFYWVITTQDSTEFLRTKVDDAWEPIAVDSVQRVFLDVRDYADSLVVVLRDSTRFVLPKQYSVSFSDAAGNAIDGGFTLTANSQTVIRYNASGKNPSVALLTQGGISAYTSTLESGDPCIVVKAPYNFSDKSKLIAVFTFPEDVSPVTIVKTLTVTKE